jgi:hypothetical protein
LVLENPRSLKAGVARIGQQLRCQVSRTTLQRLLKAAGYAWKRMRRSLRAQRDEEDFRDAQQVLQAFRAYCASAGAEFALAYFDEAGFTLEPCVPYAWQPLGTTLELPSSQSPRLNVLGFLPLDGTFFSILLEGTVDATVLIAAFDAYCAQLEMRPCIAVRFSRPNASVGRQKACTYCFCPRIAQNSIGSKSCGAKSSTNGCPWQPINHSKI